MKSWYESLKPRASSRFQLFLAGAMWSAVGAGLLAFGTIWIRGGSSPPRALFLLLGGVGLGVLKSRLLLDRTARKITVRIAERGEGRCAGSFLSFRSWALVAVMVLAGRFLRGGALPVTAVGILYVAVGTGLLFSSRIAWQAWKIHGVSP
jgi:hypothetical protein